MSLEQEKKDQFREDMKVGNRMEEDFDYFIENSYGYEKLVEALSSMKSLCSIYGHDIDEVLVRARDEI